MAKKNVSTPQSKPGPSAELIKFQELFDSSSPESQAAFLAKIDPAPKRHLIALDFHEYGIEKKLLELLDMAKAGKINGLIFAARMTHTSSPYRHATEEPYFFGCEGRLIDNQAEAIGAAVLLQNKLLSAW